jgi:hypothetical protein
MPREQITERRMLPTDNPSVFNDESRRHLHIGWNKQGHMPGWVQLSTDISVAELRSMLESAERDAEVEWAKATQMVKDAATQGIGAAAISTLDHKDFVDAQTFRVVGDVLDRSEVNRLVQVSRKARDDAYGRDA